MGNELVSDGRAAYEAYKARTDGLSLITGDTLPPWENLPQKVTDAWETGAVAAIANHEARTMPSDSAEKPA